MGDARVVALADADAASLAAARAAAPSSAQAVSDYRHVLDMPDVDAVLIALPPALHAEAAIGALQRGRHVYIEKPLATSLADARRVLAASDEAAHDADAARRPVAMMGFNYRWNPLIQQARARIAAGMIGQPVALRTVFSTPTRKLPQWKRHREAGGGVLLELAVHHIDLARFLTGAEIATVSAELQSMRTEHDTALLQMVLTNGVTAQSMFSLAAVDEDRIDVYGTDAKLTIDRYRSLRVEVVPAAAGGAIGFAVTRFVGELAALPYAVRKMRAPLNDPSFTMALEAFVRAVHDPSALTSDVIDGFRAAAVIEAAESSARSHRAVAVDGVTVPRAVAVGPTGNRAHA
jgi:predicted dehydrogenase